MQDHPFTSLPLLLVSGHGRSGTTVLRHCMNAHPEIECLNQESNYIFDVMRQAHLHLDNKNYPSNPVVTPDRFWYCHRQLLLHLLWPAENNRRESPGKALSTYSMLDPRAALGLVNAFPDLSILYVVRNGIEVVASYQAFEGFRHLTFEESCRLWATRFDMIQFTRHNAKATLIRYEWLDGDQESLVAGFQEALNRIGLEFNDACLEPLSNRIHPTRLRGETRQAAKDPSKRKDRWMFWEPRQRDLFVAICGEAMEQLGYPVPWLD